MKTILIKVKVYNEEKVKRYIESAPNWIGLGDGESVELLHRPTNIKGVPGCTYGDTDYDSESVAYGYNMALNQVFGEEQK